MAIQIINGDLLEATESIVGHQVNCQAVMGSGVAKLLKEKYPSLYPSYMTFCKGKTPEELLGQLQIIPMDSSNTVANLFGQLNYGRSKTIYTNYDALRKALTELKSYAKEREQTVALPYNIGCGLANGSWDIVEKMIEDVFADYEVTLYKI